MSGDHPSIVGRARAIHDQLKTDGVCARDRISVGACVVVDGLRNMRRDERRRCLVAVLRGFVASVGRQSVEDAAVLALADREVHAVRPKLH
jgi:hypothetical protein